MLSLRHDAEAIVSFLFAVGDGFALQALSDPGRDLDAALAAGATFAARPASSPSSRTCSGLTRLEEFSRLVTMEAVEAE